jgi:hypothetical protein
MKKVVRLTESDLVRLVKRVIMEQVTCDVEWTTVKTALEKKINMSDMDITSFVCGKDQTGFITGQFKTSPLDNEKLKCIHGKMGEWCKSQGYNNYPGPKI